MTDLNAPHRTRLGPERPAITKKLKISQPDSEEFKVYVTVGLNARGEPMEIFLTAKKAGSFEHGLLHTLALMISVGLQHGVPLAKICEKLRGISFEPSGLTGDPEMPMVKSLVDYLAQWLQAKWLPKEGV